MVNYYVISKNEKAVGQDGETLYGVCACTLQGNEPKANSILFFQRAFGIIVKLQ